MDDCFASIDLGSHTARLLISKKSGAPGSLLPLIRRRTYVRLADHFDPSDEKTIQPVAVDRAVHAMKDFARIIRAHHALSVHAVATGVFREARNARAILNRIREETGIRVRPVSGHEEALLTGKGILDGMAPGERSFVAFDLGGRSVELIRGRGRAIKEAGSMPLGAMTLTQAFLHHDPPCEDEYTRLAAHIDRSLTHAAPAIERGALVVGTGGTVATLTCMAHRSIPDEGALNRLHGGALREGDVMALFRGMKGKPVKDRIGFCGLDEGRADVILAGSLVVLRILHHYQTRQLVFSKSDILEGILLHINEGEGHG